MGGCNELGNAEASQGNKEIARTLYKKAREGGIAVEIKWSSRYPSVTSATAVLSTNLEL